MPSRMIVPDLKARKPRGYRSDMEKTGLFLDMGILRYPIIDFAKAAEIRADGRRGKQLLGSGPKIKTGLRDCYFDKVERRIFIGDGVYDPVRTRHRQQAESRLLDVSKRWVPAKGRTSICGVGNYYGTFAGRVSHMLATVRDREMKEPYYPCFVAGAPKMGTYGYVGYTFDKHPEHKPDPYDGPTVNKEFMDDELEKENTRRRNRKAYCPANKRSPYFDPNPWLVENPPKKPLPKKSKKTPAFQIRSAFRPPGKSKPMKDMKQWGTFNKLDYIGWDYNQAALNPFRPEFYGKQELAAPYMPPAGPKSLRVTPVTQANMARQMDLKKADKQELVYPVNPKAPVPFPKRHEVEARLAVKNIVIDPKLYMRSDLIFPAPRGKVTHTPLNKSWYS